MAIASSKIITGLSQLPEGVPPELYQQFVQVYNAIQNLGRQISQFVGIDAQSSDVWSQVSIDDTIFAFSPARLYVKQNEGAMQFGHCVAPILVGTELQVRFANAANSTRPAIGFISSTDHVPTIGSFCEVTTLVGMITGVSGLLVPNRYFLSTTNGLVTNVAPVAAGNIEQVVGLAMAGNRLLMNINQTWIQH